MYAKKFLKSIEGEKKKDTNTLFTEATKGTLKGAAIGAGVGLFIGFGRNKNLLLSAFVGAIIGGGISRIFITK
jgi:outer membrane lipoprotein SlyB